MLKFDADSIYNRLVDRLKQDPEWNAVINNSVISSVLRSNAETNAETARYAEYLFRESKWDTAQNSSSILAMAGILGYKPKRKISAIGNIYISLDPRIQQIGSVYPSSYLSESGHSGISSWMSPTERIVISSNNIVIDNKGNSYIPVSGKLDVGSRSSQISILQGVKKSLNISIETIRNVATFSKLDPYLYIPFELNNCENASGAVSSAFFKVFVTYNNSTETNNAGTQYRVVDSLLFSKASDLDVEVYNDLYSANLFYLKFNNDPSRGRILDITNSSNIKSIRIEYVESKGASGNVSDIFTKFTIPNVAYAGSAVNLYGINLDAIIGGKNEESVSDIKLQAPKYYVSNYTAGTKEAYEKAILNLELPVEGVVLKPLKVKVYGEEITANNVSQRVTKVVFTAVGLEDIASKDSAPEKIEQALNYYLSRLKAPQDKLVFEFPDYIAFALGIKCKVSKDSTIDLPVLESYIKNIINEEWGAASAQLDFSRNFYPGDITHLIKSKYPDVVNTYVEVEAVKKIDWNDVIRVESNPGNTEGSATTNHTMRLKFDFSDIFRGTKNHKGFNDVRTGASYVMRVDFMYKKPAAFSSSQDYHTSLFITDNPNRNTSGLSSFYICKNPNNVWDKDMFGEDNYNYSMLNPSDCYDLSKDLSKDSSYTESPTPHAYQYYYKSKVYDDNDFDQLKADTEAAIETTINSHLQHLGAVDDYLVYFESDYDSNNNKSKVAAKGWIEIGFEPIYNLLSVFSLYNTNLRNKMNQCTLSTLKCDRYADDFQGFLDVLKDWVDVYVSLRPIDSDILLDSLSANTNNSILYIDSFDSNQTEQNQNLTSAKLARMISVDCKYEG